MAGVFEGARQRGGSGRGRAVVGAVRTGPATGPGACSPRTTALGLVPGVRPKRALHWEDNHRPAGQRLSLQGHELRDELWVILDAGLVVELDGTGRQRQPGDEVFLPKMGGPPRRNASGRPTPASWRSPSDTSTRPTSTTRGRLRPHGERRGGSGLAIGTYAASQDGQGTDSGRPRGPVRWILQTVAAHSRKLVPALLPGRHHLHLRFVAEDPDGKAGDSAGPAR